VSAILTIDQVRSLAVSETGELIQRLAQAKKAGVKIAPTICITRTALRQVLADNSKFSKHLSAFTDTSDPVKQRVAEEQLFYLFAEIKFSEKFIAEIARLYQDYLGESFVRIMPGSSENILGDANIFDSLKQTWAEQISKTLESDHSHALSNLTIPILIQAQLQATASGTVSGTEIKARLGVKNLGNDIKNEIDSYFFSKSSEHEVSSEIGNKSVFFERELDKFLQKKAQKKQAISRAIDKKTTSELIEIYRSIKRKTLNPILFEWEKDGNQLWITSISDFEVPVIKEKSKKPKSTKEIVILDDWPHQICQNCKTIHEAMHAARDIDNGWLMVSTPALLIDLHEALIPPFSGAIIDFIAIAQHLGDQGPDYSTTEKLFKSSLQKIEKNDLMKAKPIFLQLHRPNKHLASLIYSEELLGAICSKTNFDLISNMLGELEQ